MQRAPEPTDGDERSILLGWLRFHRDALVSSCDGLGAEQLVARSAPPSTMSLLGLVRHLCEMERVYAIWALGPAEPLQHVWGDYTDGGPDHDFECTAEDVAATWAAWRHERDVADLRIAAHDDLDAVGHGNGRTVRWNLQKLVGEYARHNGHADLLRERIDGATGE